MTLSLKTPTIETTKPRSHIEAALFGDVAMGSTVFPTEIRLSFTGSTQVIAPIGSKVTVYFTGGPDHSCDSTSKAATVQCPKTSFKWGHRCRTLGTEKRQRTNWAIHLFFLFTHIWEERKGEEAGFLRGFYIVLVLIKDFLGWNLYSTRKIKTLLSSMSL